MFGKTAMSTIPDTEMIEAKYPSSGPRAQPARPGRPGATPPWPMVLPDPYELKRALGRDLCDTYHSAGAGDAEARGSEFDRVFRRASSPSSR
ncbi:MAG: hypothetical protein ACLTHL_05680 [Collinsella sp.]